MKARSTILMAVLSIFVIGVAGSAQKKKTGPPKYTLAANTVLRLRLSDPLTSKKAHVGDQFRSTVVDPVYAKGFQVIPAGSIVIGHVTHVVRASRKSNAGSLNVTFTGVQLPNGKTYSLNGSLAQSGSADNEGEVKGKSSKKRNAAFIAGGAVVGGLINGAAGMGIGAGAGIGAALIGKGKEADVKAGTEFNMILNRSVLLPEYKGGG
ncbi:MAG TPA: hypothetical protein VE980_22715 [Pyrinomonadaceae bacterium]|nr:hypothetical protein [Pyrinomonadaceae bacterium]HYV13737.1 hypothetical protein [Pyrinomonadaceae bacterium]